MKLLPNEKLQWRLPPLFSCVRAQVYSFSSNSGTFNTCDQRQTFIRNPRKRAYVTGVESYQIRAILHLGNSHNSSITSDTHITNQFHSSLSWCVCDGTDVAIWPFRGKSVLDRLIFRITGLQTKHKIVHTIGSAFYPFVIIVPPLRQTLEWDKLKIPILCMREIVTSARYYAFKVLFWTV